MNEGPGDARLRISATDDAELDRRILAIEQRMQRRRGTLLASWQEVEGKVGAVLAPRAWLWPLALGAGAGCLLGLLWRRGDRHARAAGPATERPRWVRPAPGRAWQGLQSLLGPWLRATLGPLMQQWLRPAVLEAAEALLLVLIGGLLRKPPARGGGAPPGPAGSRAAPPRGPDQARP